MKKIIAGLLALVMLSLTACGGGLKKAKFNDGGDLICGGVTYKCAPIGYEPTTVGVEYAKISDPAEVIYRIGTSDASQWLTEAYNGEFTTVFYSESLTLPTLADFGAEKVYICQSDEQVFVLNTVEDAGVIASLSDAMKSGETVLWPRSDETSRFELKFESSAHPEIFINLIYVEGADGTGYLYSRGEKKCVACGDLIYDYINDAKEEAGLSDTQADSAAA